MKTLIIDSEIQKTFCRTMLNEMPMDGSNTVIFKKTDDSPTARQRRLQWKWYTEVSLSGLGQDDDKMEVHIRAKMMFAHPILMRDDEVYPVLYQAFKETVKTSVNYALYIKDFANQYISTERLTKKQRAEYLTEFQKYWTRKGVELTDPILQGLGIDLIGKPKQEKK